MLSWTQSFANTANRQQSCCTSGLSRCGSYKNETPRRWFIGSRRFVLSSLVSYFQAWLLFEYQYIKHRETLRLCSAYYCFVSGYTARIIKPAKNADVISLARAMNPDMGPRVQKLFEVEKQAAIEAQQSGIYIGWRCPEFTWDCQRVSQSSKCFCGHLLNEHEKFTGQ